MYALRAYLWKQRLNKYKLFDTAVTTVSFSSAKNIIQWHFKDILPTQMPFNILSYEGKEVNTSIQADNKRPVSSSHNFNLSSCYIITLWFIIGLASC